MFILDSSFSLFASSFERVCSLEEKRGPGTGKRREFPRLFRRCSSCCPDVSGVRGSGCVERRAAVPSSQLGLRRRWPPSAFESNRFRISAQVSLPVQPWF